MSVLKKFIALTLCIALCLSCIPMTASAARDFSFETELADSLYALNLFKGTGNSYALESPLTRPDSVIMLLRLYGELNNAKAYSKTHPFTDVPSYADLYISYAKDNGLAYGRSDTLFGSENVTAAGYLTFVLRALGYSDKGGKDFTWDNPFTLADEVGILPTCVDVTNFLRADVVSISYAALAANMADGSGTLAEKLIRDEVFSQEDFDAHYDPDAFISTPETPETSETPEKPVLDSESVYAKCSSSVFYIEVYDANGSAFASGSGFFIDSNGTAVTNYHVIEDAYSAKITLTSGEVYDVTGVYDYSADVDWAVLKINGSGFNYLTIGDKSTAVGGAKVYALGSPLGLQDTFSDGMISNANRVQDGVSYIQISAPISHGSSGGALINKYGEVIGICSAGYVDGQNLNLALPITCIEGFDSGTVTPLSVMFPGSTVTPTPTPTPGTGSASNQQLAYEVLRSTIRRMYNGIDDNGCYYYRETLDNGNTIWFTDCDAMYGEVQVCIRSISPANDIETWSFLYLNPDSNCFEFYFDTYEYYSEALVVEGTAYLYAPITSIHYTEKVEFDKYTVGSYYRPISGEIVDLCEELAYTVLMLSLIYTDTFFTIAYTDYGNNWYTVEDFGLSYE